MVIPSRHARSEQLFHAALVLQAPSREPFVRACSEGDPELYREVMELLQFHDAAEAGRDGLHLERAHAGPGDSRAVAGTPPPPPAKQLASPTGRYDLLDVLGEGSMGIVYLAQQTAPVRRRVALKIIKLGIDSRQAAARFASERQALALMNHPNIARVFEAGTSDDGRLYFAMEYVGGPSITDYCDKVKLPLAARLELFVTVCNAVQHAHQKGIIHRDLKPGNVLVDVEGERPIPKIIDFGVAKATNQRLVEHTLYTLRGVLVGSLESMSPEQVDPQSHDIDTRADLYALGVVLYRLLVGAHPLRLDAEQLSYAEIERRILDMEPVRPSLRLHELGNRSEEVARLRGASPASLARALRGDLDWIVSKALEKDRHRRYQSAAELGADVQRHMRAEPVLAGPPGTRYRLTKFVRRNRGLAVASAAVLAALGLGLISTTVMYLRARDASRVAREQRDQILQLSDRVLLQRFLGEAEALVPPLHDKRNELDEWLREARKLEARLPQHRRRLDDLARAGQPRPPSKDNGNEMRGAFGPTSPLQFKDDRQQFEYDELFRLVASLQWFAGHDTAQGTIAEMQRRLDFSGRVYHESIEVHRPEWDEAIASIADPAQCPLYRGLRMQPQEGLVPLGRDPDSGLWEFGHLQSGALAQRSAGGRLSITEATGLVFVLIPGGCFFMGATRDPAALPPGSSNRDPKALDPEGPVQRVCLDPFLLSKYEVTQAQWLRSTGTNPSDCRPGALAKDAGHHYTLLHPVEHVNWAEVARVARLWGAQLPTEAQWEYAARAGTSWPWYAGPTAYSMRGKGNFADLALQPFGSMDWPYDPWNDGYPYSAPVGRFDANGFGLHDALGNVSEWCADYSAAYAVATRPGDGLRLGAPTTYRMARGSNWTSNSVHSRVSWRIDLSASNTERLGLRPAIPLQPAP